MPKILIADDDAQLRGLWAINLSARGYDVAQAVDGRECLALIESEGPDAILLDIGMPRLSGWEVLEDLRSRSRSIPVILVTALDQMEVQERARQLGTDVLYKPLGVDALLRAVERAVGNVNG